MNRTAQWLSVAILLLVLASAGWWAHRTFIAPQWSPLEGTVSRMQIDRDEGDRLFEQARDVLAQKRFADAAPLFRQAAERYERAMAWSLQGTAMDNLGWVELEQRHYAEAISTYRRAQELYERGGMPHRLGRIDALLGDAAWELDRYEDARGFYQQARARLDPVKDREQLAYVALYQSKVEAELHDLDAAADYCSQAAALAVDSHNPVLLGKIAEHMAWIELARRHPMQAKELWENALFQYTSAGSEADQTRVRGFLKELDAKLERTNARSQSVPETHN